MNQKSAPASCTNQRCRHPSSNDVCFASFSQSMPALCSVSLLPCSAGCGPTESWRLRAARAPKTGASDARAISSSSSLELSKSSSMPVRGRIVLARLAARLGMPRIQLCAEPPCAIIRTMEALALPPRRQLLARRCEATRPRARRKSTSTCHVVRRVSIKGGLSRGGSMGVAPTKCPPKVFRGALRSPP